MSCTISMLPCLWLVISFVVSWLESKIFLTCLTHSAWLSSPPNLWQFLWYHYEVMYLDPNFSAALVSMERRGYLLYLYVQLVTMYSLPITLYRNYECLSASLSWIQLELNLFICPCFLSNPACSNRSTKCCWFLNISTEPCI